MPFSKSIMGLCECMSLIISIIIFISFLRVRWSSSGNETAHGGLAASKHMMSAERGQNSSPHYMVACTHPHTAFLATQIKEKSSSCF
jgi:hypothetical protein